MITERESAHPSVEQLNDIANAAEESKAINDITNGEADISQTPTEVYQPAKSPVKATTSPIKRAINTRGSIRVTQPANSAVWHPSPEWVQTWRSKLPLQTIMRLLQVLVPQVEKICIDK